MSTRRARGHSKTTGTSQGAPKRSDIQIGDIVAVCPRVAPSSLAGSSVQVSIRLGLSDAHGAQPSILGKLEESNWREMFETARMPRPSVRTKTHWSALGHVTSSPRPSGEASTCASALRRGRASDPCGA